MSATDPDAGADEAKPEGAPAKSFGNISEHHWSKARAGSNQEALEYYRQRSHAPGVEQGGSARNFYCMQCDGVIPYEPPPRAAAEHCPHCGASLEGIARRYFNWVEINEPAKSDLAALLPLLIAGALVLFLVLFFVLKRFL